MDSDLKEKCAIEQMKVNAMALSVTLHILYTGISEQVLSELNFMDLQDFAKLRRKKKIIPGRRNSIKEADMVK